MDAVEQIKARIAIEDLVGEYVQLKKAGRNFKGLCPFHSDHSPSFLVSPDKGICWCFVCQSGGDIFEFFQKIEGMNFPDALHSLAEKAGVVLPEFSKEKSEKKKGVQEVLDSALEFYRESFKKSEQAQEYWKTRKINQEMTDLFQVGYAPDSFTASYDFLKKQGFPNDQLTASGLEIEKDDRPGEFFDRFRGRIMIPIKNHLGKVVGFGGRIIQNTQDQAKYINSPETALYSKSHVLFGLDKAKEAIREKGFAVILEGYMDVIASHQAGVKNAVAVSGVALTKEQLKLLKRYTNTLKLCFDQDQAGSDATKRSIELAAEDDFNIEIVMIEGAKDTDELIKKGNELWKEALEKTISPLDFFFLEAAKRLDIKDIVDQKTFVNEMFERIQLFPSVVVQQNYVRQLAEKCGLTPKILTEDFERSKRGKSRKAPQEAVQVAEKMHPEQYLLGILFAFPQFIPLLQTHLIFHIFGDEETKDVYKKLLDNYNASAHFSVFEEFEESVRDKLQIWQLFVDEKNEFTSNAEWEKECLKVVRLINDQNIKRSETAILKKMQSPELPKEEQQRYALKLIAINKLKTLIHQS